MDLNDFDLEKASDAGAELSILHPTTGEKTDIVIRLTGPDSKKARLATRKMTDALADEAMKGKAIPEDEMFENMAADHAAGITLGWSGIFWGGEEFCFNEANAIKLYRERRWIREQVEGFAGRRANFFRQSTKAA